VYVAPRWRRQGIAKGMLSAIVERLRTYSNLDHVILHVSTDQDAPRQLYASLGFETFGCERRAFKIGDEYIDQEQMVLWL
jgi:RimJ/RimL family protein N-acetyltransferase